MYLSELETCSGLPLSQARLSRLETVAYPMTTPAQPSGADNWQNQLHFGDNLPILRDSVPDESVDLVYLDPPFNSNATYNVLFRENDSSESAAQIQAFDDTWHWNIDSERAYREVVQDGRRGYVGGGCCGWRYGGWLHS